MIQAIQKSLSFLFFLSIIGGILSCSESEPEYRFTITATLAYDDGQDLVLGDTMNNALLKEKISLITSDEVLLKTCANLHDTGSTLDNLKSRIEISQFQSMYAFIDFKGNQKEQTLQFLDQLLEEFIAFEMREKNKTAQNENDQISHQLDQTKEELKHIEFEMHKATADRAADKFSALKQQFDSLENTYTRLVERSIQHKLALAGSTPSFRILSKAALKTNDPAPFQFKEF